MATKKISDGSFDNDVIRSSGPVLVDFWAPWCGPCRVVGPALEDIAEELGERITIAKLNIDENPISPAQFGVRSIPTMILFKDGAPIETKVGALPKSALRQWVESQL